VSDEHPATRTATATAISAGRMTLTATPRTGFPLDPVSP
jgi:hypothetical protein